MNSRLPIIKQRQRDHLFQSHAATRWWFYSLFRGLWSSPLQGTASFERKSYTLPFTQSHSETTCSTAIHATTETEKHDCPRNTNRIYRGDEGPGMQDTGRRPRWGPCQRASHQMHCGLLFPVKELRMTWGLPGSSKIEEPRLKSCLRFNDHQ